MIVDNYGNYVRKFMWQLCGWGIVDICMTFHKRAFDFFISRVQMKSWAREALETVNCCAFLKRRLIGAC
jgi:hypothetical protein